MKVDRAILPHAARLRLATRGAVSGEQPGERRSRLAGRGVELADHRPYGAGDELRLVDWNAWQRLGTLQVRLFHESRGQRLHLALDTSASMGAPAAKADHAATVTAALAMSALLQRDAVRLSLGGGASPRAVTGGDGGAMAAVLKALETAEVAGQDRDHLARTLGAARVDRAVLITDLLVPPDEQQRLLRALAAAGREAALVHVLGPDELHPPLDGPVELEDSETGELLVLDGGPEAQAAYQQALDRWLHALPAECSRLGVRYVAGFSTSRPDAVLDALRRARVLEGARGVR